MVARVYISAGQTLISRPGFDVLSAGADQLLLGAGKYPMQIAKSGSIVVPSGGSGVAAFGFNFGYVPVVLFQSSSTAGVIDAPYSPATYGPSAPPIYRSREGHQAAFSCPGGPTRVVNYVVFRRTAIG